ncbi:MAG TPA: hypothetical protein VIU64_03235 [Polyangia bacterium]
MTTLAVLSLAGAFTLAASCAKDPAEMGGPAETGSGGQTGSGSGGSVVSGSGGGSGGATVTDPGPLVPGCTPGSLSSQGTLMGQYGTAKVMAGGREYFLQVNEWNSTSPQTMSYGGPYAFKMTEQMGVGQTSGGPAGFPSLFIGANANHSTSGSNLPKQVSALQSVLTTWNWNDNGTLADKTTNIFNATYDVWFSTSPSGEPSAYTPTGGFLMVWLHKPTGAQPIGSVKYPSVTIPGVPGQWNVWIGMNGKVPCISYVATQSTLSLSTDLNAFIKDAVANRPGTIQSSWYLTNVFTGFEIWKGGVNLESTSFCAVVE